MTDPFPADREASDLCLLSASDLSAAIVARRVSPVDVVDAFLARIDRFEPKLQAFIDVYRPSARLAAEAAHKAIASGHGLGPLHGVPIALKDLIELEGRVTTGGSAHWKTRRSAVTATVATKLLAQGMIVLGKTHTVEFAFGGWGTNQHLGTPLNPHDLAVPRVPGGSSSGSGVAVAACLAPWAIGTDTGGSVRLPSSYCGLTGLKVTIGRVSTYGILPLSATLDTPGPITRSARDAALLFDALQGPDPLDPNTRGVLPESPMASLRRGVRGLRLGRMPNREREGVAADVLAAYDASLDDLARLGAEIVDVALPFSFTDCFLAGTVSQAEAYFNVGHLADEPATLLDEAVRKRVLGGKTISAHDYLRTRAMQRRWKAEMHEALEGLDALLTPTTETAAIPLTEVDQDQSPSRFTRFGNLLEMCALALPNGFTPGILPLSLQIVCRGFEEATALRIGHAYQEATHWHRRRPALPA